MAAGEAEAGGFGFVADGAPGGEEAVSGGLEEAGGVKVAVPGEPDASGDAEVKGGVEFGEAGGGADLGVHAEGAGRFRRGRLRGRGLSGFCRA